ncbi:RsmB/NOP family class I SAM-dependent RNA methyltransferase [Sphingobacterium sp. SYP-B4668]|uniref:RsmB/NOP family class I SAM-dependent RNA methyltransferase n=1 Tax=Sphingobacterium sp. SYP-B4668 TaxID=2996035 RepID=UPI0022DD87D2|nr:RsmB/NOP family class I SAM-dependent RNA methyltransferase [Sphingobacterium sp. SYP-B4668]
MEVNVNEKRVGQQIRSFERVLSVYQGKEPFARFLTQFFRENKQMGSSDRRMTSRLCYNFFRIGNAAKERSLLERLTIAEFLCEPQSDVVAIYQPLWVEQQAYTPAEKLAFLTSSGFINKLDIFPCIQHLSPSIDTQAFLNNQFEQPHLYIRVRRGSEQLVERALIKAEIAFQALEKNTWVLKNGTNLQLLKGITGHYEVQDLSSQQTMKLISVTAGEKWWDACAASGGKALLFLDQYPGTDLLVSDIRMSILRNLDERFDQAGIKKYRKKIIDLTKDPLEALNGEQFDGIILDAPCSGSGTWGRSPEMIAQFKEKNIASFSVLQRQIAKNVLRHLKPGGTLLYITCSVFKEENEDTIQFIEDNLHCRTEKILTLKGYEHRADTMFAAKLVKV